MPDFGHLLNYKDFGEALYTELQLEGEVRKISASFGNSQIAQVADLRIEVNEIKRASIGTSGIAVTPPADISLTADAAGTVDPAGQLPLTLNVGVSLLGLDVLADPRTEVIFTPFGVTGSELSQGEYEITAVSRNTASVRFVVNFAGVKQGEWQVAITKILPEPPPPITPPPNPVPPPPDPTPPPPTATPAQSFSLASVSSNSFVKLGELALIGGFSYAFTLSAAFSPGGRVDMPTNIQLYLAQKSGTGNWSQVGPTVDGDPTEIIYDNEPVFNNFDTPTQIKDLVVTVLPGQINLTGTIVLPAGAGWVGVFGRLLYGPEVRVLNPCVIAPI